jgi:DNA-binding transcriptional regulator YiaG
VSDTDSLTGSKPKVDELLERVRARRVLPPAAERRRIREQAGVSQHEVAKALGVSWTAVYRWEQGSRPREHEAAYAELLAELQRIASVAPPEGGDAS